ncbi:MAG: dihydroorotase [Bacteroidota bacterium]|jgi:dihydroorotase
MNILIKSAEIIDSRSNYNGQVLDVQITNGVITAIGNNLHAEENATVIPADGLKLSIGWCDIRSSFRDPGFEHKEDIRSGCAAAAFGGYTDVAVLPNTKPAVEHKETVHYIKNSAVGPVSVHPMAFVTLGAKGEEMTEMLDLHHAGAVAFTDANKPIWHPGVLVRSLQYLQLVDGLLIQHAEETTLTLHGQINEGKVSTFLGLKGIPKLAEELIVARDIELLKYAGGRIHFSRISSPKSIELIKAAKKQGLNVTCDVAVHHLLFTDKDLNTFDTNLKVNPPLRSKETQTALWKAVNEDIIDLIVTDHTPQDEESKKLEFDQAEFGMLGLQTAFAALNTVGKIPVDKLVNILSITSRELLKIEVPTIEVGAKANLTLFSTDENWTFTEKDVKSKSLNTPFIGKTFKGKVKAVINKNQLVIN